MRWYQREAVDATYAYIRSHDDHNPLIVLPTGAGKTRVISTISNDVLKWGGRVIVLSHVKELLQQCADDLSRLCGPENVGIYSAGLKRKEKDARITVAGIQSCYEKAFDFGAVMAVIIDEAHLVPMSGDGMYLRFLRDLKTANPSLKCVGLTATPYRLDCGTICGDSAIFQDVAYEADIVRLMNEGYLCPVVSKGAATKADLIGVHMRGGEYVQDEMAARFDAIVTAAGWEIGTLTEKRNSVLIFAASIAHANELKSVLSVYSESVAVVTGESSSRERGTTINDFKSGALKYLINVAVLTTGFDATNVDCVCLLRATQSPGLYAQMVGRGLRVNPNKENCLVLDFGGNVLRHGPIDCIKPPKRYDGGGEGIENQEPLVKECPNCRMIVLLQSRECMECGHVFPLEARHDETATDAEILSKRIDEEREIIRVEYSVHTKKGSGPDMPKTLRVDYLQYEDDVQPVSEWVCVEHSGYAREKALTWWTQRCNLPMPNKADEAVAIGRSGAMAHTESIIIHKKSTDKFWTIDGYKLGDIPSVDDIREPEHVELFDESEVPF